MKNYSEYFLYLALKEAQKALEKDEVPVGAIIVKDNKVIARAHNLVESKNDATAHCEILAIKKAQKKLKSKYLNGCILYVTLEPCPMCAGAAVLAKIDKIVFGARDPKAGACGSVINIANNFLLNHRCEIETGIMEEECSKILTNFFKKLRGNIEK